MSSRDFTTLLALLVVLLIAGSARSAPPPENTDLLSILNGTNPVVQRVMEKNLGELDRAGAELRSTRHETARSEGTRGHEQQDSLGIGAFGEGLLELQGLPPIYARNGEHVQVEDLAKEHRQRAEAVLAGATARVAECYGEPTRDGSARDSLSVQVVFDTAGRVLVARIVQPTRFGARGADACVAGLLQQTRFAPGLTENVAQVGYRWTFDLGAPAHYVFAPTGPDARVAAP